jgi:hypothetical protein
MTDAEVRQQVERADGFIADFRELIAPTVVDLASPCEAACLRGLERIAATVDAVDYGTMCNLANINAAMCGGLLDVIEVQDVRRRRPDAGLCRRGGVPRHVPAGDRHGAGAAAQLTAAAKRIGCAGAVSSFAAGS